MPDFSRDRGDTEALPLGLYTRLRSVEVGSRDFDACGTQAGIGHLGCILLV